MSANTATSHTVASHITASHTQKASVVIVVPRYTATLASDEVIALKHLYHYLGGYDRYYICPQSLALDQPDMPIHRFDDSVFESTASYSKLLLSAPFYETFAAWQYVLIYQLDCLVFSDQLAHWCAKGYDYIGPPWLRSEDEPEKGFWGVGNGGFSLRKVETFLKVIENSCNVKEIIANARRVGRAGGSGISSHWLRWAIRLYRQPERFKHNEDGFWSKYADKHYAGYSRPSPELALSFGFECAPEYCFEMNNRQLPFGCHAWARYNRAFWEPYLLRT